VFQHSALSHARRTRSDERQWCVFNFSFSAFQFFSVCFMSRISEELRVRTRRYASTVIRLYAGLPTRRKEVEVIGHQLLRAGTSVAAHSREASRARSDSEFCSKLDALLQEADESQLWLELLRDDCGIEDDSLESVLAETNELLAIFTTIVARMRKKADQRKTLKS